MKLTRACMCLLYTLLSLPLAAQTYGDAPFTRPLSEVFRDVEQRFEVRITCKNFSPDTVMLRYADSRIRPYSLSETMDNLLKPLDLKWDGEKKLTVRPYEYHRRTPADGKKLLAWLSSLYGDCFSWEQRAAEVKRGALDILDLEPYVRGLVEQPNIVVGKIAKHDGYTTQNFALETLPGLYACGTIYAPLKAKGLKPLIMSPAGHWPEARYRADQQYRMATFARMGAVAVDVDIVAWGESEKQLGIAAHQATYAMQVQVLWSKVVTDWILSTRKDIDTKRMAATGGSGGATHTLMLAMVDPRFTVLAPVVHLVSHFDGGCPCESGRPVTLAAGGSAMPELLAAVMAPRPTLIVSDGGDWTHTYPSLEYPFLQRIWGFYGAEKMVENAHFPDEKHDYGFNKRAAVYQFFVKHLGLDASKIDETKVKIQPHAALQSFPNGFPAGAIQSAAELEQIIAKLK